MFSTSATIVGLRLEVNWCQPETEVCAGLGGTAGHTHVSLHSCKFRAVLSEQQNQVLFLGIFWILFEVLGIK